MIRKFMAGAAFSLSLAGAAAAQDIVFDSGPTELCLQGAGEGADGIDACIGIAAQRCMERTQGGYSTYGMGACFSAEADWWDGRLNAAYRDLMAGARETDAMSPDYAPSQAEALRGMQRAWIAFRDARCGYEMSQWGGGTGGGPAYASCVMDETARQSQFLLDARLN